MQMTSYVTYLMYTPGINFSGAVVCTAMEYIQQGQCWLSTKLSIVHQRPPARGRQLYRISNVIYLEDPINISCTEAINEILGPFHIYSSTLRLVSPSSNSLWSILDVISSSSAVRSGDGLVLSSTRGGASLMSHEPPSET